MITALVLFLVSTAPWLPPAGVRCTTYEEKTLNHWQTICADGTRSTSTWNKTLQRWETRVTPPAGVKKTK